MTSSSIANFKQSVAGTFSGYRDQAYLLSQKFYDVAGEANEFIQQVISMLTDAYYGKYTYNPDYEQYTFENEYSEDLYASYQEFATSGTLCLESTKGSLQIKQTSEQSGHIGVVIYAGSRILCSFYLDTAQLSNDTITIVDVYKPNDFDIHNIKCVLGDDTVYFDLLEHLTEVAKGRGMMYGIASLCETIGDATADTVSDFASIIRDAASKLTLLPSQFTIGLSAAALGGPGACIQFIAQFVETLKTMAEDQTSNSLFASTNIALATFSAGAIMNTVGTIVTTIGMIVMAVSRIAGIIVSVIGIAISFVSKIVSAVFGEYDKTRFKVSTDLSAVHVYSYVINQGYIYDHEIATLLRTNHTTSGILYSTKNPAVVFVFLSDPNSLDDEIGYEIHLSSDYNVSSCFQQITKDNWATAWSHPVVYVEPGNFDSTESFGIFQRVGWSSQGTRTACLFRDTTSYHHSYMPSPETLMTRGYEPIDTGLFANIASVLSDEADAVMKQHFLSAIFLFAYSLLYDVVKDAPFDVQDSDTVRRVVSLYKNTTQDSPGYDRIEQLFCMLSTALFMPGADAVISNAYLDDYLSKIKAWFDGLEMQQTINSAFSESVADVIAYTEWSLLDMTNGNYTVVSSNFVGQTDATRICQFWHPYEYAVSDADHDKNTYRWNTSFAVELPSITWSGFVAGLIIDGLIVAAAAAVAVAATVLKFKVANKRAQLQAKAESAWYNYEDNGQTTQQWKDYKAARFKYNVMALCTGGTTLSVGLYDDDSSTGIIGTVRQMFSKDSSVSSSDNVTLEDNNDLLKEVRTLIKGN